MGLFDRPTEDPLVSELRAQLEVERERSEKLLAAILELRRDGFQMPPRFDGMSTEDVGLPDAVMDAVEARGSSPQAKERLVQYARRMMRTPDVEPADVARMILDGDQGFTW